MRAKEYAAKYESIKAEKGAQEAAVLILAEFILESKEILQARRVSTDPGLFGVVREIEQKWRAFAGITGDINPLAFRLWVRETLPGCYKAIWKDKPIESRP